MVVNVSFASGVSHSDPNNEVVLIVGKKEHLEKLSDNVNLISVKFGDAFDANHFAKGVKKLSTKPTDTVELWFKNFILGSLPSNVSRHNAPMTPHALTQIVQNLLPRSKKESIVIVCERKSAFALGLAVSRAFPLYMQKTSSGNNSHLVIEYIFFGDDCNPLSLDEVQLLQDTSDSIRLAAKIVDMPCNIMHTDAFIEEVCVVGKEVGIIPTIIKGKELDEKGFGGLYGVGKAAVHQPALVILSHTPAGATKTIAWCGKGIVYDTGGLSIKDKTSMPGMKRDCGGAAGILGAFRVAVKAGFKENLHAVFCLAENAVGPLATRPDDVHTLYSGLSVEINNTDAEGRLVLGDGVAYAKKDLKAEIIIDMATLTGAQGIATGKYHAAILTNNEEWELHCVKAGKISGDLVFPVPYCPELHFDEFNSCVADMKNSVKSRFNAQVSCAGLFIGAHIGFDFSGVWLHIDMAAPVELQNERGSGYGVALLLTLFSRYSHNDFLQKIALEL